MLRFALPFSVLLTAHSAMADNTFYSQLDVSASSEPVSIADMVTGWDGDFQAGEYAYADARFRVGLQINRSFVETERREFYYLEFNKLTSRFYRALDQGEDFEGAGDLDLSVENVSAQGLRFGHEFKLDASASGWGQFRIRPALAYYKVGHHQFGDLEGILEGNTASATLDYNFDEDKILEFEADVDEGTGWSLDLTTEWDINDDFSARLQLQDLWNRWQFDDSAFTDACINFGDGANRLCDTQGTASGRSGQESFTASINVTHTAELDWKAINTRFEWAGHGRYQRLGAEYYLPSAFGEFAAAAYSTNQLGLSWNSRWHVLRLVTDDLDTEQSRDVQVEFGFRYSW